MHARDITVALLTTLMSGAAAAQCPTTIKLVAGDPGALDTFGASLSACRDVTTNEPRIAIGASDWDAGATEASGRVYVHGKVGAAWGQLTTVQPQAAETNQRFGASVAMIDPYMIVGAPNNGGIDHGNATAYIRAGSTWSVDATFLSAGTGQNNTHTGAAVALTTNGGVFAAVAAPDMDYPGATNTGAVWFYKRVGAGNWDFTNSIQGNQHNGDAHDHFGFSVSLSPDNGWAAIGAPERTEPGNPSNHGTVTLCKRDPGGAYQFSSLLVPPQATGTMRFGHSVAIAGDLCVVGAPYRHVNGDANAGSAYVFRKQVGSDTWAFEQILTVAVPAASEAFGTAVAIENGRIAVNAETTQRTYLFENSGGAWHQAARLRDTVVDSSFGYAGVELLGDYVFTAAPYDDASIADQGTVHVLSIPTTTADTPQGATVFEAGTENVNRTGCTQTASPSAFPVAGCGNGVTSSPDVWYSWTPTCDANVIFDTFGSNYDTVLSVHSDIPDVANNYQVACNDDASFSSPNHLSSLVTFNAEGNHTYYIRVSGYNGAAGSYVLRSLLSYTGSHDTPAQAKLVTGMTTEFRTCNATTDPYPVNCPGAAAKDVWFRFTPDVSGMHDIYTCYSQFDTVMMVYSGTPQSGPQGALGCSDDASCGGFPSVTSRLNLNLIQGNSYLIRVGGYDAADFGEGVLTIVPPISCDTIDFNGDTLFPDTQDIDDFITVFGGGTCAAPNPPQCNSDIDFNNDGLYPDTLDIEALLSVFSGGPCM